MQVTPGIVLTDVEDITVEKLNQLGTPVVALEDADKAALLAEIETELGNGVAGKNYFWNPAFDLWTRGTSAIGLPLAVKTPRADQWWARPNGITSLSPTYAQAADTVHQGFLYAAQIKGNSGVGALDFGQDVDARRSAIMANQCTVTVEFQNNTGAAITPHLRLDTCDTLNNFATQTNRYDQALSGAVNNGAAGTFSVNINTTAFAAQMRNGASFYLRIASGALDSNAKYINFYNWKLEVGTDGTARYAEVVPTGAEVATAESGGGTERNYWFNGDFAEARWGANASCSSGIQTFVAAGNWARPSAGNTLAYTKQVDSPNALTKYCAKLTGTTDLGAAVVDFGQDFSAGNAAMLTQALVFSCYVRNDTAGQITPSLFIDVPTGLNDWSSASTWTTQLLDACPTGIWTRLVYAFSGASISGIQNGLRMYLRFDTGVLGAGSDSVRIAQMKLELGTLPTPFIPSPTFEVPGGIAALARNLVVATASASSVNVSFDGLALASADNELFYAGPQTVNGISIAVGGANGLDTGTEAASVWYAIYVISNGVTFAGLFSQSATAPVLPGGYRFAALVGFVRNDGSSNFISMWQSGRIVWQTPQMLFTAKGPANAFTYEAVSVPATSGTVLAAQVPPAAKAALGTVAYTVNNPQLNVIGVAADANGLGQIWCSPDSNTVLSSMHLPSLAPGTAQELYAPHTFRVALKTAQEFYWIARTTDLEKRMEIVGYEL